MNRISPLYARYAGWCASRRIPRASHKDWRPRQRCGVRGKQEVRARHCAARARACFNGRSRLPDLAHESFWVASDAAGIRSRDSPARARACCASRARWMRSAAGISRVAAAIPRIAAGVPGRARVARVRKAQRVRLPALPGLRWL